MPYLKPATLEDAVILSKDLRPEDEAEIRAMSGQEPVESLIHGVMYSNLPVSIMDDDDSIMGMFGAVPYGSEPRIGAVWMLASPRLLNHRRQFARESRQWIEAMLSHYDVLFNVVDERNDVHVRWLQWCGFTFINRHPKLGAAQIPFLEFVKIKEEQAKHV